MTTPERTVEEIQYPNEKGEGCRLACGVSFVHYHLNGDIKKPIPYNPTTEDEIVYSAKKKHWFEIRQFLQHCLILNEIDQKDFEKLLDKILRQTLQAERQKREEMVEAERLVSIELYQALKMMYTQYCPEPDTHEFMTAGENAEEKLDCYSYLNCDCEDTPEQQEENGHTRYCKALTNPNNPK